MQCLVDIDVDPEFKIHTSYHNSFFLLRTKVLVDGKSTEIRLVKEGGYEEPALSFSYSGNTISTKLWPITDTFSPIFRQCGVYHIDTFYYEQSPLFHVVFSSESCLKKFLSEIDCLKHTMEVELLSIFSECLKTTPAFKGKSSQSLAIEVLPDLFLVVPNQQKVKGAQLHSVTKDNCSNLLANWKDSELFEFASLYQEKAEPPKITSQPISQKDILKGSPLSFIVGATGTEPMRYQWQWNPAGKEGEQHEWQDLTSDGTTIQEVEGGLKLADVQACNAGDYRCVVSNSAGSEISECASLTVAKPPKITSQPMRQKDILKGSPLSFIIRATGTEPMRYQWQLKPAGKEGEQHEWQDLTSDGTTIQEVEGGLKLAGVQACNAGDYRCVVSNSAGSEISQCASLSVAKPPKITSQPMSQKDILKGSPLSFIIRATGTEPMRYQWQWKPAGKEGEQHEWQDLTSDGTTIQEVEGGLKLAGVQACNAGDYRCVVSNYAGSEISQRASITVVEPPKITSQPMSQKDVVQGALLEFAIRATGRERMRYQWQWKPVGEQDEWQDLCSDGTTIQEVEDGLKLAGVQACNAGDYRCVVSNSAGSEISQCATLTVVESPKITCQPMSQKDILQGRPVSFMIRATGSDSLSYRWQWKPAGKEGEQHEWQVLSSDGTAIQEVEGGLKLVGVQACNAGDYRCIVSNSAGSEMSESARLTVAPEFADLVSELQDVNDWVPFGLLLGIKMPKLEAIRRDYPTIGERRTQMLYEWQNSVIPTWSAVVQALSGVGMRRLASDLAQKHGVVPDLPDDERLKELKNALQQKQPCEDILEHSDPKRNRSRSADIEERHQNSLESKAAANKKASGDLVELEKVLENMQKIVKEKNSIEKQLKFKEQECHLLTELTKVKDDFFQEKLAEKQEEIKKLKEELRMKDQQLKSAQEEARMRQKELSQAQAKLRKKHEEMKELERERQEFGCSYNIEKLQVSKRLQISTSDKEGMKQQLMRMEDESKLKSQQIEANNASIRQLSEEIEALSNSLQEKKATVAQLWSQLQTYQEVPEQLLHSLPLMIQIVQRLEHRLQEAEYQKQQVELERGATIQEVKVLQTFEIQLHAELDEPPEVTSHPESLSNVSPTAQFETRPQRELQTPLKLRWRKGRDMLWGMWYYPKTVQLHNNLYVGGGHSPRYSEMCTILVYDTASDCWSKLPEYHCRWFGITAVHGHLTLVGGEDRRTGSLSNQLGVFDPSSQQWMQPYPSMITPRRNPEVATYNNYLLAAGGYGGGGVLTTVEVLNVGASEQWLSATQLPVPCELKTSAILHDNWYVITASKQVMYASLPELCTIPQTVTKSATNTTTTPWRLLPDVPLERSTAVALRGSLLTVGGRHGNTASTAIHLYDQDRKTWTKVGDLPTPRYYCSVTLLSTGELLVSGGEDQQGKRTTLVDVATIVN